VRIVTSGAGGGADFSSRLIAQGITGALGQQVIVDNRGGVIPMELVSKSPPDGYTLLLHGSTIWLQPLLRDNVPWEPLRDFAPISLTSTAPNVLVVHPSLPVKNVKELIALAKAQPGALNYYTIGAGTSTHLATELFKAMAGVNIVMVNYKGTGAAMVDLLSG
jgi:tripartite-type tricarboxylate transporter receptor subunit TctC